VPNLLSVARRRRARRLYRPSIELVSGRAFYRRVLHALRDGHCRFLVGGGYALRLITGLTRQSADLDVFVRREDVAEIAEALRREGFSVNLVFKHWLAKVYDEELYVDLIFSSGNGVASVDDVWFDHAIEARLFDVHVRLCPPEEMIWSKAYVMERERCDVADVAHLVRAFGPRLDWRRLLGRFGDDYLVLLAHLTLLRFIYPDDARLVPPWVMHELMDRARREVDAPVGARDGERLCNGTLLSREQFLTDIRQWGYRDARQEPLGKMRTSEIDVWTAAIGRK
jgi:hypothetical protein